MENNVPARTGQLPQALQSLDRIPGLRQALLLLAVAASVALGVVAVLWLREPTFTTLPAQVYENDAAEVTQVLAGAGIEFRDEGDRILVPVAERTEAMRVLRDEGLLVGPGMGYETLEEAGGFGNTSMGAERLKHRRMLEVELARTIADMRPIKDARVLIGSGRESVFVRERTPTTASVTVTLHPGRVADEGLVASIMHLVSSAVPELNADNVTVVDQFGRMLSPMAGGGEMSLTAQQMRIQEKVERDKVSRIRDILGPALGHDNFNATVTADMDFTVVEETMRTLSDPIAIGSSRMITENRGGSAPPLGVPGALSNEPPGVQPQPAAQGDAQAQAAAAPLNRTEKNTVNSVTGETITRVVRPRGTIDRLTVAVVVNSAASAAAADGADGEAAGEDAAAAPPTPYTAEQLRQFEDLVRNAIGFDADRGDTITIVDMPFREVQYEPLPPTPWWEVTFVVDLLKQALGALFVLVLFFTTVRPAIGRLLTPPVPALPGGYAAQAALTADDDDDSDASGGARRLRGGDTQEKIAAARALAAEDPNRVALILEGWMKSR